MDNSSDNEKGQRNRVPKDKEVETSADLEAEQERKRRPLDDESSTSDDQTISIESRAPRGEGSADDPSDSSADISQEDTTASPPGTLKELVRIYLDQVNESELKMAGRIAGTDLRAVCHDQPYAGDRYAADLAALGRARRYLQHLSLPYEDTDDILVRAKANAQVSKAPVADGQRWLNSLGASSCMYLVTFFLGKWLTAFTGIGLVFTGPAGSAALAALVNALVVPLTQALAGDPMGGALRNFGPSVASEDSRQYAAFMTAHALYMRAHIAGTHSALAPKFAMEMDRAINAVVWREQGKPGTATGKPLRIASGVDPIIDPSKPKAEVDAELRASPYTKSQRYKVVAAMLARILVSDELPVHTFTLLNGVTGYLNTLWPAIFGISGNGPAISRAIDAAAHTGAGFFAMYFMFLLQDWIRPMVQGVGPIDPTNDAYLEDKSTPKLIELTLDEARLSGAFLVEDALLKLKSRLKKALRARDLQDEEARNRLSELLRQCKELCRQYEALDQEVGKRKARTQDDIRALTTATGAISRMVLDTCRVVSGRTGHTAGTSWTDGSPSVVRGVSKYLAYVSALTPVTVMSIATSRKIGTSLEGAKAISALVANSARSAGLANMGAPAASAVQARYADAPKSWIPPVMPSDVTLSSVEIEAALKPYAPASGTTAMVAILGWNTRNVLFDPLYQHVIHAGIGLVERLAASCAPACTSQEASGMTETTTVSKVVGAHGGQAGGDPLGASSEAPTRVESETELWGSADAATSVESGPQSDRQGGTSSDSRSDEETAQSSDFIRDLHQTAQELTAMTSSVFGDVGDTVGMEEALQTITSEGSVPGSTDSPNSSNDRG